MDENEVVDLIENNSVRILFIVLGMLMVGIGVIGLLLPVMPTTPFLLLAAFFFARSSKRFYNWLITNRFFGEHIKNYREKRGIKLWVKILTILSLWISITFSAFVFVSNIYVRAVMFLAAALVTIHVMMVRTFRD